MKPLDQVLANLGYEPVEELSKKTLTSYVKKATGTDRTSIAGHAYEAGKKLMGDDGAAHRDASRKTVKRIQGVSRAVTKLTAEEIEMLDSLAEGKTGYLEKKHEKKAETPALKEEIEQVDEADVGDSYAFQLGFRHAYKGQAPQGNHKTTSYYRGHAVGKKTAAAHKSAGTYDEKDAHKHSDKAQRDLNEEVEQVDEISRKTLQTYSQKVAGRQLQGHKRGEHTDLGDGSALPDRGAKREANRDRMLKIARQKLVGGKHTKIVAKEEVEKVEEADAKKKAAGRVSYQSENHYADTHGKRPGAGGEAGTWFFSKHKTVDFGKHKNGIDHIEVKHAEYKEAKRVAKEWAQKQGHEEIHVQT